MVHGVTAVHGVAKSQIRLSDVTELNCMPRLLFPVEIHGTIPWVRAWQPTPAFLPGESRGQRSLVCYSPQGHKSRTRLKQLSVHGLRFMGSQRVGHD